MTTLEPIETTSADNIDNLPFHNDPIVEFESVLFLIICLFATLAACSLTCYSQKKGYWKEKGTPCSVWCLVVTTSLTYVIAIFLMFLNYIFVILYGWDSDDGNPKYDDPSTQNHYLGAYNFYLFTLVYLFTILFNIYVWIQRLETTFANSVYGYSSGVLIALKVGFAAIVVLGFVTMIGFFLDEGSLWVAALSYLFGVVFLFEISALIIAFIVKLVQLRKLAESRFNVNPDDIDPASLHTIKKLVYLQLKLTILAIVQITSTFVAILWAVPIDGYQESLLQAVDVIVGFFCVYCSVKSHDFVFQKVCCCFIICFKRCVRSEEIERRFGEQIQLHTQSQMGSQSPPMATAGRSEAESATDGTRSNAPNHSAGKSTTMQTVQSGDSELPTTTGVHAASNSGYSTPYVGNRNSGVISVQSDTNTQDFDTATDTKLDIVQDGHKA